MMRFSILALAASSLAVLGCKEVGPVEAPPAYHLSATFTEANTCQVSVLGNEYSSIGQIRGDVPKSFVGTVPKESYHGFGCWVATSGGDGDVIVLFSGNNLGKPLAPGTYSLTHNVLDDTPAMMATVTFRTSAIGGDKLVPMDGATGNVIVTETENGGRLIKVEADVVRW
ncbi:MAG TPA: hypothetical protein VF042_06075, partial [Gemmatimonadaceae bacterium]